MAFFVGPALALHVIPDHLGDAHFTSGPCPNIEPPDGAACPNSASTCPAFYNPALLPTGYNSVSYCATVPGGVGYQAPGIGLLTRELTAQEQKAFLKAARKVESYVKNDVTVVVEPYAVSWLDANGNNYIFFGGDEYWNPVCAADALLPPYSNTTPAITANADGSNGYLNLPETYTTVLTALKNKNAANRHPMELINYLPSYAQINVEWPPTFFGWQYSTDVASDLVSNFLVGISNDYPVAANAKPFTLCAAPAAMKMLGLEAMFSKNGHTINDINSPRYNMYVTLEGTDGAVVIPDAANLSPANFSWLYDSTDPQVVNGQLPKAFFTNSLNLALPWLPCADPSVCLLPAGAPAGFDLIGAFNHEINHVLGVMQSQYYKVPGEGTSLAYGYGTALFLLDLFDLDSDYVEPGYGHQGIKSYADFTFAPRNNNTYGPTTIGYAPSVAGLTPWIQFGHHDHLMVYDVIDSAPQYFPLMNYSVFNPDGDIQGQEEFVYTNSTVSLVPIDPNLVNLGPYDVYHDDVQATGCCGTINVDTIREYSELAAEGWDIDYSTLRNPYNTISPLAKWYRACFDANGVFTTSKNKNCKFSVFPKDLEFLE